MAEHSWLKLLFILSLGAIPIPVWAAGMCPDIPIGGGESIQAFIARNDNTCSLQSGMYTKKGTRFRLDSVAEAQGQCLVEIPDCDPQGCTCVFDHNNERTIHHINVWEDIAAPPLNGRYTKGYIYGKDPYTGQTEYYHVLDSRQPNSTGSLTEYFFSAGLYIVQFQAVINNSPCVGWPAVTSIVSFDVNARSALHKGAVNNGSLNGGRSIDDSGVGFVHYLGTDAPNTDDWGGQEGMEDVIRGVALRWFAAHTSGPRLQFGDISRQGGGYFYPHSSHQNGLDVDLRYVRNDGTEGPLNLSSQYSSYSRTLTIELLRFFADTLGRAQKVFVDPNSGITSADVPGLEVVVDTSGEHVDHMHLRIYDPDGPDTNNC